jgi:hypothetical protein
VYVCITIIDTIILTNYTNNAYISYSKVRVREMERQREVDAALLSREYCDDYDDQVRVC